MNQLHKIARNTIAILPERIPAPPEPHWAPNEEGTEQIRIAADVPLFDGPGPTAGQVNQQDEKDSTEE